SGNLYMSSGTTTSGGLQNFSSNYASTSYWQGLTAYPEFGVVHRSSRTYHPPTGKVGRLKEIRITFAGTASGGRSLDLNFVSNAGNTTTTIFSSVTSVTTADLVRKYTYD